MTSRNTAQVLGISIDRDCLDAITARTVAALQDMDKATVFACANPHSLVAAQQDAVFHSALTQADIVVADGVGITALAKVARVVLGPRITGIDYFLAVTRALQQRGYGRVFFFGSSQHVLDLIAARFKHEYPELELVGVLSPPFGPWSVAQNDDMLARINAARPDVLWVGMTAPKQEKWVQENREKLKVAVIASIGAVFDFYAGTYPRAPQWLCSLGLEWLFRLIKEPRRMWRRNFISTPKFVALVLLRHTFAHRA